ncbi:MAG: hypothetical protein ACJAVK_000715 [Akkermansiaceae bacterium]
MTLSRAFRHKALTPPPQFFFMSISPYSIASFTTFVVSLPLMGFIASRICRNEDDSFQQYGTLFIFIPLLAGACGTFNGSYVGGSIACGLASLALTTLIGNLSLKNCLLLAITAPLILCIATWLGNATETLLS